MIEPGIAGGELLDHGERRERAEVAVVAAGVAHRVDMRAEHQRGRVGVLAFVARAHVADRVDPRAQAGFSRPLRELLAGRAIGGREIEAGQLAGFVGEGGEGVEPRHQPARGAGVVEEHV